MTLVARYAAGNREEAGRLALQTLNAVFDAEQGMVSRPWAEGVRTALLDWCLEDSPTPMIAVEAMRLLPRAAREDDLDHVAHCYANWPPGLCRLAPPTEWLKAVYAIAPEDLRDRLEALLAPGTATEIQARGIEALAVLRAIDQAQDTRSPGRSSAP